MSKMNYKNLTLNEIKDILSEKLDTLTDEEAFDLMQRYNELTDIPMETSAFNNFDRLLKYNVDCRTKGDSDIVYPGMDNWKL